MANISQTAANVAVGASTTSIGIFQAGEALTQGQPAYKKASDQKWYRAGATTAEKAGSVTRPVIVLTPVATNGYFVGAKSGAVNLGATLTVGTRYAISATDGAIAPEADITSTQYVTSLGVASTAALLALDPQVTGIARP